MAVQTRSETWLTVVEKANQITDLAVMEVLAPGVSERDADVARGRISAMRELLELSKPQMQREPEGSAGIADFDF